MSWKAAELLERNFTPQNVTFLNQKSVPNDGYIFNVGSRKTLTVEVFGTSTSRRIEFYGLGPSGTPRPISGVNLNGFAVATYTTGNGELWQFDITGLVAIYMKLVSVSGGNQSAIGEAVS